MAWDSLWEMATCWSSGILLIRPMKNQVLMDRYSLCWLYQFVICQYWVFYWYDDFHKWRFLGFVDLVREELLM